MKKLFTLLSLSVFLVSATSAQDEDVFGLGVRWSIWVFTNSPDGYPIGYPGKQVEAIVMYKDSLGTEIYRETHAGTLNDVSQLAFTIGQGNNPTPPARLPAAAYRRVAKLCWEVTVQTDQGPVLIKDMQDVSSVPKANFAFHAGNAERLSNNRLSETTITPAEFLMLPLNKRRSVVGHSVLIDPNITSDDDRSGVVDEKGVLYKVDVTNLIACEKSIGPDGEEIDVLRIGSGEPKPIVFGDETPDETDNYFTICALLGDLLHAFAVKVLLDDFHSPVTHNTAAIFADNTEREMSAGVLASAQTWGVYGTAQNGVVGITNGPNNGAGTTGFVASAPDPGGFKYALYGHSNSQPSSWGAAIFGNGFHTGTWTMTSDARLKKEIRTPSNTLDKVLQLRPSSYTYRQDTPYSLPEGLHHGFLAQDVETIFPELVSDITMPLSLDPQEIYKSGTTEYKGINYIEMIAILTSALQEMNTNLNAKIDLQAKEIAELRTKLNARAN